MRTLIASVVLASLLLSGCSGKEKESTAAEAEAPPGGFTVIGDNRILSRPTTDTYHLLAKPRVTTVAPDAYEPIRIPIDTSALNPGTEMPSPWSFTLPNDLVGFVAKVLTGAITYDSRIRILGLEHPLDSDALLLTT